MLVSVNSAAAGPSRGSRSNASTLAAGERNPKEASSGGLRHVLKKEKKSTAESVTVGHSGADKSVSLVKL